MCHRLIPPHSGYVVRIEVFAEPSLPATTREAIESTDHRAEIKRLIAQMSDRSAAELQDDVYRRMAFTICAVCQQRYLENPLPPP